MFARQFPKTRLFLSFVLIGFTVSALPAAFAQQRAERTIEEIKVEAIKRAQTGMYPMIGLDPADVEEAFASIKTRDKDEWATAFMHVADRYMAEGKSLEKIGSRQGQRRLYPRLAHLLLWAVAHSFVAEEKRILRQSHGSVSGSREVLGSTSGGGAHSVRRFRDYRLSTPAEECQGSRAHGHCRKWAR